MSQDATPVGRSQPGTDSVCFHPSSPRSRRFSSSSPRSRFGTGSLGSDGVPSPCERRTSLHLSRDFKAGETIGHGSYGRVFAARYQPTGHILAVKELLLDSDGNRGQRRARLARELRLCEQLKHPRIVRYFGHEFVQSPQPGADMLLLFLEHCSGGSVASHLKTYGSLEADLLLKYMEQLIEGVVYLHGCDPAVVHRDLKCANLLLSHDADLKIADFGCSKWLSGDVLVEGTQAQHTLVGSVFWMAPEVLRGGSTLSTTSDIWSLGCCLLEMAAGAHPWFEHRFDNIFQACKHIAESSSLPQVPSSLMPKARAVLDACLARDPGGRLSARELLDRLEQQQ